MLQFESAPWFAIVVVAGTAIAWYVPASRKPIAAIALAFMALLPGALRTAGHFERLPSSERVPAALAFASALTLAALLLFGARLPEWLFPLRGRWLKYLLGGFAVLALLRSGPWMDVAGLLGFGLLAGLAFYLCSGSREVG